MKEDVKALICIGCPLGCMLSAQVRDDGGIIVTGNSCPKGKDYAIKELTDPRRVVTTVIRVINGKLPVVSAKTKYDIPKGIIYEVMKSLKDIEVEAPVKIGQVLVEDIMETGVPLIATKNIDMEKKECNH